MRNWNYLLIKAKCKSVNHANTVRVKKSKPLKATIENQQNLKNCIAKQGEKEGLFLKSETVNQLSGKGDALVGMWDYGLGERYSLGTGNNNEVMF